MTPPQIDALLARLVFGWDQVVHEDGGCWVMKDGTVIGASLPLFTGGWGGMQMVVEEMSDRGFVFVLTVGPEAAVASFFNPADFGQLKVEKKHDEAPLAVAVAALKALGEEVE